LSSQIAGKQHDIQAEETTQSREGAPGATQAGTCWNPEPPFPKQRQPKPGRTRSRANVRCALLPRSGKLTDKVAIVTTEKAADFQGRTPTTHPAQPGGNRSGLRVSSTITFARVSSSENPTHYRQAPEKSMKFVRCFCKRVLATAIASGIGRRIEQAGEDVAAWLLLP
jgi:hypothetical protein